MFSASSHSLLYSVDADPGTAVALCSMACLAASHPTTWVEVEVGPGALGMTWAVAAVLLEIFQLIHPYWG